MSVALRMRRSPAAVRPAIPLNPDWEMRLLLVYIAVLPFQIPIGPEFRFAPADCVLLAAVLVGLTRLAYVREAWSLWHLAVLLTFVVGSLITALDLGSLSRYVWLNKDVGLLLLFLTYILITSTVTDWAGIRRCLRVFVVGVAVQNVAGILAFLAGFFYGIETPLTLYGGRRLAGMMVDPNAYGGLLVLALVLCEVGCTGPAPLLGRWQMLFCRLSLGLGILFTFSRGAWCALALAMFPFLMSRARRAIQLVLAAAAAVTAVGIFAGDRFLQLIETMATRPEQVRGRFELMDRALFHTGKHPVLGGGLGSFIKEEGTIVHNTPLWFLADFGLVGLVVFAGFAGWFALRSLQAHRFAAPDEKPVVLALLLGHVAMLGVGMGIEAFYQRHWWLIMGLVAAACAIEVRRRSVAPGGMRRFRQPGRWMTPAGAWAHEGRG